MERCEKCGLLLSYPNSVTSGKQKTCNYCRNFKKKNFLGEKKLIERLKSEEQIGVTVSGGKDSIYLWYWAVSRLGPDKVIAFNHRKVDATNDLAIENIQSAAQILKSKVVIIEDHEFYPRFINNLNIYINTPNPAILRAVLCAGCRNGISNRIFEECRKYNIKKVINGASYLELAPFKGYHMAQYGDGSETKGLLKGLMENENYLTKDNLEVIIKDHYNCHHTNLSNKDNQYDIDYIDFYDYFENNPEIVKNVVVSKLNWKYPKDQTWHFDCIVEDFKQLFYFISYGYTELDYKYSEMVRYQLLSREASIHLLNDGNVKIMKNYLILREFLQKVMCDENTIQKFDQLCKMKCKLPNSNIKKIS